MNKNILKLLIVCTFISLQSCAQNKKESDNKSNKMEKIEYQKEGVLFKLKYEHTDCSYEILVNDMPVITYFGLGERSGLTVDLNQYILKPGKQEITIRMFPSKKEENTFSASLTKNSFVKIEVSKNKQPMSMLDQLNAKDKGEQYKWEQLSYQTSALEKETPYAEYKTSFEVDPKDINWKIIGWSESQDLKNDSSIRKEVDAFYEDFKRTLETGSQSKYLAMLKNSIHEEAASTPWDKTAESQITQNMAEYAIEKRNFIYPCKNAELKFFGNGKVVTLVCMDTLTFGYSPLISKTAKNMMPKAHTFYLHKPKGSDKLEIIR
ncbi:hypothetical protein [Chryseobacterium bernardetii]|uniref:hypothetical protein n=2 Tax=Chryseobacterium group TaxID=2782232 RepID=UPI001628A5CD|nr:hypothetical protein [Chryseobacterium bernardetii]